MLSITAQDITIPFFTWEIPRPRSSIPSAEPSFRALLSQTRGCNRPMAPHQNFGHVAHSGRWTTEGTMKITFKIPLPCWHPYLFIPLLFKQCSVQIGTKYAELSPWQRAIKEGDVEGSPNKHWFIWPLHVSFSFIKYWWIDSRLVLIKEAGGDASVGQFFLLFVPTCMAPETKERGLFS